MKKPVTMFLTFVVLLLSVSPLYAQFEGKIVFSSTDMQKKQDPPDNITLYVTPKRILLQGDNSYDFMGSIKTEGVLIRLDYEDFVFLSGDNKALKISKSDITSMATMFGGNKGNSKSSSEAPSVSYKKTDETQTIQGYKCQKFVFTDKDDADNYAEVWMTKDLEINWGMLAGSWSKSTQAMMDNDIPVDLMFNDGYFPLKMTSYKNGEPESVVEATEVKKSSIAKAMVQIPPGVEVLSFQDYLFQKMNGGN